MPVQPAKLDQVIQAYDGGWVIVDADVGGIAKQLKDWDPCLRLRVPRETKTGQLYVVYRLHRNGQPCRDDDPERTEEFVTSAEECDQRLVDKVMMIDPEGRGGYDFVKEVERNQQRAEQDRSKRVREKLEEHGDKLAWAIRKDLGARYQGRAFITNKPEGL